MRVHVSPGNRKMGGIPSVSLPPGKSCPDGVACLKDCYAKRMTVYHPSVGKSWERNWEVWQTDPVGYLKEVQEWICRHKPRFFRWHVGGDIPDRAYMEGMRRVAQAHPEVKFLCFTKRYEWAGEMVSVGNLSLVFSAWPGVWLPKECKPVIWMQDGTETRIPEDAWECPGGCENCQMCYHLREAGRDVWVHKH